MPRTKEEILLEAITKRNSQMYSYYKAIFEDGFEGGYSMKYDDELKQAIDEYANLVANERFENIVERVADENDCWDEVWLKDVCRLFTKYWNEAE